MLWMNEPPQFGGPGEYYHESAILMTFLVVTATQLLSLTALITYIRISTIQTPPVLPKTTKPPTFETRGRSFSQPHHWQTPLIETVQGH
jgi:hypothetical protein